MDKTDQKSKKILVDINVDELGQPGMNLSMHQVGPTMFRPLFSHPECFKDTLFNIYLLPLISSLIPLRFQKK